MILKLKYLSNLFSYFSRKNYYSVVSKLLCNIRWSAKIIIMLLVVQ